MPRPWRWKWELNKPPDRPFMLNAKSPQSAGIVAWWPGMGQGHPSVVRDYTNRGHDADWNSTGSDWGTDSQMGHGYGGTAGANSNWVLQKDIEFSAGTPFSLAIWCKATAWDSGYGPLIGNIYTAGNYTRIYYDSSGTQWVFQDEVSDVYNYLSYTMSTGSVYHLVFTYDGSDKYLYVNGSYETSVNVGSEEHVWHTLGSIGDTVWCWVGYLYDTRFYDWVLGAAEIWQLYDPATRWDLYQPIPKVFVVPQPAAAEEEAADIVPLAMRHYRNMRM